MPVRTGEEYLTGLQEQAAEVYICGERVKDVTTHPALRNAAHTIASLYDMQHQSDLRDEMTHVSPTSGDRVGLSFIYGIYDKQPATRWVQEFLEQE